MFGLFLVYFVAWPGFVKVAPWNGAALPNQLRRDKENLAH